MIKSLIDFETAQPLATRFFTRALEGRHMVNAYVMKGKDLNTVYKMVLRLAQIINCQQRPGETSACGQCQSCRWIEENAHPGVITVSNMTYLSEVDKETGLSKSKTGKAQKSIVVAQLNILLKELGLHSGGFHRVVILTGAQEGPAVEAAQPAFPTPRDWTSSQGGQLELAPLDRKLFPDPLANKFLKTLEEPPLDAIFFLLTDTEDKLLETIVSRCQTVPFVTPPEFYDIKLSLEARNAFGQILDEQVRGNFMQQMRLFSEYLAEGGMSSTEGLAQLLLFLQEQLRCPPHEPNRYRLIKKAIEQADRSRLMIKDKVKEEAALEDLFLHL